MSAAARKGAQPWRTTYCTNRMMMKLPVVRIEGEKRLLCATSVFFWPLHCHRKTASTFAFRTRRMTPLQSNNLCVQCLWLKVVHAQFLATARKNSPARTHPITNHMCHTFTTHMMYSCCPAHSLSKPSTNHLTLLHLQSNGLLPNRENDPSSDWSQGLTWYLSTEQWTQLDRFMNSRLACHDHDQAGAAGQGGGKSSLT
jgi:hypothetical protein